MHTVFFKKVALKVLKIICQIRLPPAGTQFLVYKDKTVLLVKPAFPGTQAGFCTTKNCDHKTMEKHKPIYLGVLQPFGTRKIIDAH